MTSVEKVADPTALAALARLLAPALARVAAKDKKATPAKPRGGRGKGAAA